MGNVVVPVGIGQEAVAIALEAGDEDVAAATAIWEARRDLILAELDGLPAMRPGGGWSLLIDGSSLKMSGAEMSTALFRQDDIDAQPMEGWGSGRALCRERVCKYV